MILQADPNLLHASDEEKQLRQTQFSHLKDVCYLDYTGAGVYAQSQINKVSDQLKTAVFSHPHGSSVLSNLCVAEMDQMRERILHYLDTDSDQYYVIFTSGATSAIRTVSECFEFNGGSFVYLTDNHTSVLGMRELVKTNNVHHLSLEDAQKVLVESDETYDSTRNSLFVYPAQSNFSGRKYPLSWTSIVQNGSKLKQHCKCNGSNWFVLLDAATYCTSNKLSLTNFKPDFVCMSFYKMFGYPTGLGALIVKKSSAHVLHKQYYGGGTVKIALANENFHRKKDDLSEKFEDGTINYLSVISLGFGFDIKEKLSDTNKSFELAQYTYWYMKHLYYPNNNKAVELYLDNDYSSSQHQGSIINFNILRKDGTYYGYSEVQNLANLLKIQLRTGCHCNPGACQTFLGLSDDTVKHHFQQGHVCGDDKDIIDGKPTGSVRISYGYASNWDDVKYFLSFLKQYFLQEAELVPSYYTTPKENNPALNDKIDESFNNLIHHENIERKTDHTELNRKLENPHLDSDHRVNSSATYIEDPLCEGRLNSIFLYPVKACGYYKVKTRWEINESGLLYDRQWMIVNQSGVVLTQKLEKNLCLIQPDFDFTRNVMILCYRGSGSTFEVPLEINGEGEKSLNLCKSKVCRDSITGYDCGDDIACWLDNQLNQTGLRLIRLKQRSGPQNLNSFSNMGQYLLITKPSIEAQLELLANKYKASFELESFINRFRSNFVISGHFLPNAENEWSEVTVNTSLGLRTFEVKKPCVRCQYIYIDQETGQATDVPLGITKFGVYINNNFVLDERKKHYLSINDKVHWKIKST